MIHRWIVLVGNLALTGSALAAGEEFLLHPGWVDECLKTRQATGAALNLRTNPYYLRGDFDGDNKSDYAVAVKGRRTKRNGVLFCMANKKAFVVGADQPLKPPFSNM